MYDRTDRLAREDQAMAELDRVAARAREAGKTARVGALLIVLLILGAVWAGYMAPLPEAHSAPRVAAVSPVRGTVDVCAIEVPKSWTKGLQRKANRALQQRVRVHRVTEWTLADQPCDLFLWGTESSRQLGLSPDDASFEVLATAEKKKQRPAAVVRALKAAGIR